MNDTKLKEFEMVVQKQSHWVRILWKGSFEGGMQGLLIITVLAFVAHIALMDSWYAPLVGWAYVVALPVGVTVGILMRVRHYVKRAQYARMLSYIGQKGQA